ncbi:MAG: nucleotidyl transferase AbiEii/AbiGii toxin family protein [bacterium]|nr:nucleotidyl transferase AbiEii/AbiGii toxin family protein [bacterium]
MLIPQPHDALHRAWLYRLLTAIADDSVLASLLHFKGGTCAAMRGFIDRFSVDLDFELKDSQEITLSGKHLERIFASLGLKRDDRSNVVPQYFLKYSNPRGGRNSLRVDITCPAPVSNTFEKVRFADIDRILSAQTLPTLVANKMVALMDRFERHGSIAGRDIYDIHQYLLKGYPFNSAVIEERRSTEVLHFLKELSDFIEKHITLTNLDEDLNPLLPPETFRQIRKTLKRETILLLKDRIDSASCVFKK